LAASGWAICDPSCAPHVQNVEGVIDGKIATHLEPMLQGGTANALICDIVLQHDGLDRVINKIK
jgi:hypothetical protein